MAQTATAPKTKTARRSSGWSDARRAKHAAAIKLWAPWAKSTGPKTAAGKARSAQNAFKHGGRSLQRRLLNEALSAQNRFLCLSLVYGRLYNCPYKKNGTNELLKRLYGRLTTLDRIFHVRLYQSLNYPSPSLPLHDDRENVLIMQKTCFFPPPAANS